MLALPAGSVAMLPAIETSTSPSPDGVIEAVYEEPLPLKDPAVPLVTVRSPTVNPVTVSLNVIVMGIGETLVVEVVEELSDMVGAVRS